MTSLFHDSMADHIRATLVRAADRLVGSR